MRPRFSILSSASTDAKSASDITPPALGVVAVSAPTDLRKELGVWIHQLYQSTLPNPNSFYAPTLGLGLGLGLLYHQNRGGGPDPSPAPPLGSRCPVERHLSGPSLCKLIFERNLSSPSRCKLICCTTRQDGLLSQCCFACLSSKFHGKGSALGLGPNPKSPASATP